MMFKNIFTKQLTKTLMTALLFVFAVNISEAQQSDYVSTYDCLNHTVYQTMQFDLDSNDEYDTYGLKLCGENDVQTFPLVAIGDIRRWPPMEGPTRSIVFDNSGSLSLLETYYDDSGSIIAWFQKSEDNDTVYFHNDEDTYDPINFSVDSSSSYIQAFPNPADQVLKIHYVVMEAQDIQIQLLDYEGNYLDQILRSPSGQGEYMMVFPVNNYTTGYYRLRFIAGSNNYIITVAIVH